MIQRKTEPIRSSMLTFNVLEFINSQTDPVSSRDISEALLIPESTLSGHLLTLEVIGYIERVSGTLYKPTIKLAGMWAECKRRLTDMQYAIKKQLEKLDEKI